MRQIRKRQKSIHGSVSLAVLLFATAAVQTAAGDISAERKMEETVKHLLDGSSSPADVQAECLDALQASGDAEDFRELTTTYLNVPSDKALPALCAALVQGVADGDITEQHLRPMLNPTNDDVEARTVGQLMRAIYFSHQKAAAAGVAQ